MNSNAKATLDKLIAQRNKRGIIQFLKRLPRKVVARVHWLTVKYGFRNLLEYRKIIWRDRDWDHYYLYKLIEFKLRRMARLQAEYGSSTIRYQLAAEIEEAADCLHRAAEDDYELYEMIDGQANSYQRQCELQVKDLERFSFLFSKCSLGWWD